MADENSSAQEKTEQPTPKRKQDSRKKGQVARSRELNTMLSLLSGALALALLGGSMADDFAQLFAASLTIDQNMVYAQEQIVARLMEVIVAAILILTPFFLIAIAGSLLGPMLMGGWVFTLSNAAFKLEKLSPLKGLKKIFSPTGLMELVKTLLKFVFLSTAAALLFMAMVDDILVLSKHAPDAAAMASSSMLTWGLVILSLTMGVIASFDVPFSLWNHNKQLKMTRKEVQDEMKETDGRPEVKSRIKALQREIAQGRMMQDIPAADVVITNPTHFAVAIRYDEAAGSAPRVVAKGRDLIALKIRAIATEHNVASYEFPPLARALYATTDIGDEIPRNLYLAVAKVLAYIYQLKASGSDTHLEKPGNDAVPEEYRDLYREDLNGDE
ncbi:flagellar biosynthesis protein FlhB [Pseudohalioglobus lutimaris]|uniref:Flagellar biosynthetic protein FlhB n=1 Tax=Pseudohalioglobus lutimaris TaxID=1737061 RepID=A0A2N5X1E7_9GAMM|nr:flagellar biosynthesis protein FlhB [Pseudohalioglobus lutimaris]PLW68308.1 flagellar biosynthesis protein FlhB [Pseudohalioglobus lutimaris]